MTIKVQSLVTIYEVDGEECVGLDMPTLTVRSHWNHSAYVEIEGLDGKRLTVAASELMAAIQNAKNRGGG
jgi:hypothetical protein